MYHLLGIISVRLFGAWEPGRFADVFPLSWLVHGHFGVPLFFAISGFVLALPFADHVLFGEKQLTLPRYYLRRVARLGPPYVINLLFLFVALMAMGHLHLTDWPHLLASICCVHNIAYDWQSKVNGVAWSLETEVQFYLVAPFLAAALFRIPNKTVRRATILGFMTLSAVAVELFMPGDVDRWNGNAWRMSLLNYLHFFLVGFILVDCYLCDWRGKAPSKWPWAWDTFGIIAWVLIWSNVGGGALAQVMLPIGVLVAYAAAFRGCFFNSVVRNRWIFTIGGMCYTIYLWHQTILTAWGKFGLPLTWKPSLSLPVNIAIQFMAGGTLVLVIGSVLFAWTERPFMKRDWYRRLWQSQPDRRND